MKRLALGLVAGAFPLAVLWAANRLDQGIPFAPLSLAERVIRATPGDIATFFIELLQHNAIRLLAVANVGVFSPARRT